MALAAADTSVFPPYPTEGTPTWIFDQDDQRASFLALPVRLGDTGCCWRTVSDSPYNRA
jgi:hypothetical protein